MKYISESAEETKKIASDIAQKLKAGGVVALIGDLGAGKTTFTQGFAKGLGITDKIISPTFVLIRIHPLPNSKRKLFHIDLYRLEGRIDLKQIGLEEIISDPQNIVLIEWAEKIKDQLKDVTQVKIRKLSSEKREIEVS